MTPQVHPSSFISDNVNLANNVKIGPYCYLNGNINIGENTELKSHVVISGNTNNTPVCIPVPKPIEDKTPSKNQIK